MVPKEFFEFDQHSTHGKRMFQEFWDMYRAWLADGVKLSDIIVFLTTGALAAAEAHGYTNSNLVELLVYISQLKPSQNLN